MPLQVLKAFTEGGKRYEPGDSCPIGLPERTIRVLIRGRYLHDPEEPGAYELAMKAWKPDQK